MTRIDPDALARHLEVAQSSAPVDGLAALQDTDHQRRRWATYTLCTALGRSLGML